MITPIFLVGAERSGTTLLRLMLDDHPLISWLNEFEYAVDQIKGSNWPNIEDYVDYLSTDRIFQATRFTIDNSLEFPELIESFLLQKQQRDKKPIIGATCHRHYDRLLEIFPQARFIHLIRDPRDVARSNVGMGWAGNVWKGVDRWHDAEKLWEITKQKLATNAFIDVRYEELIVSPQNTLTAICHFLGTEYNSKMMSYSEHTTYAKPNALLIEQWKSKLTQNELEMVESKVHTLMKNRNYEPFSTTPKKYSLSRKLFFLMQDKWVRVVFRVKRYGLGLTAMSFLARKLRLKSLDRQLKIKFNERTKLFLK